MVIEIPLPSVWVIVQHTTRLSNKTTTNCRLRLCLTFCVVCFSGKLRKPAYISHSWPSSGYSEIWGWAKPITVKRPGATMPCPTLPEDRLPRRSSDPPPQESMSEESRMLSEVLFGATESSPIRLGLFFL